MLMRSELLKQPCVGEKNIASCDCCFYYLTLSRFQWYLWKRQKIFHVKVKKIFSEFVKVRKSEGISIGMGIVRN